MREERPLVSLGTVLAVVAVIAALGGTATFVAVNRALTDSAVSAMSAESARSQLATVEVHLHHYFMALVRAGLGVRDMFQGPDVKLPADSGDASTAIAQLGRLRREMLATVIATHCTFVMLPLEDGNTVGIVPRTIPGATPGSSDREVLLAFYMYASNATNATHPFGGILDSIFVDRATGAVLPETTVAASGYPDFVAQHSFSAFEYRAIRESLMNFLTLPPVWTGPWPIDVRDPTHPPLGSLFLSTTPIGNASAVFMGVCGLGVDLDPLGGMMMSFADSSGAHRMILSDSADLTLATSDAATNAALTTKLPRGSLPLEVRRVKCQVDWLVKPDSMVCRKTVDELDMAEVDAAAKKNVFVDVRANIAAGRRGAAGTVVARLTVGGERYTVVAAPIDNVKYTAPPGLAVSIFFRDADINTDERRTLVIALIVAAAVALVTMVAVVVVVKLSLMPVSELATALRNASQLRGNTAGGHAVPGSAFAEVFDLQLAHRDLCAVMATFATYVPRDVLRAPARSMQLHPVRCSVVCVDVHSVVSILHAASPPDAASVTRTYMEAIRNAVRSTRGTIVSCTGDGVLAVWGALRPTANHEVRACLAALLLHRITNTGPLCDALDALGDWARTRVGVATGAACAGVIGGGDGGAYTTFAVTGDAVTMAMRLQSRAVTLDTRPLISETTASRVGRVFVTRPLMLQVATPSGLGHTFQAELDPRSQHLGESATSHVAKMFMLCGTPASIPPAEQTRLRAEDEAVELLAREGDYLDDEEGPHNEQMNASERAQGRGGGKDAGAGGPGPTVCMLDEVANLPDEPLEVTSADMRLTKACRRIVQAYAGGRLRTAQRRAERLLEQLPEEHPALLPVQALAAAIAALSTR